MRIDKYTDPSKLDLFPYGTLWRVKETEKQFVQISDNEKKPIWIRVEEMLGRIAYCCNPSHATVVKLLDLYKRY